MGTLKMRTFLSGMPECKLGLNDKVGAGAARRPFCYVQAGRGA
jgi:hypothetical protein